MKKKEERLIAEYEATVKELCEAIEQNDEPKIVAMRFKRDLLEDSIKSSKRIDKDIIVAIIGGAATVLTTLGGVALICASEKTGVFSSKATSLIPKAK